MIARHVVDKLDPDGGAPAEPDDPCPAAGELHIRDRRDGGISLEGWLEALHGIAFRGLIEQLAKPRPLAENIPDPRTAAQRNADALVEICDLAHGHDQMSAAGGEPPHVTVTVNYDTLIKQLSGATLDYGQRLSAAQTRLAACDCKIIPVVLGGDSEPLDVGRAQRTAPLGIRRALVARDRGCTFPGCDRAPRIVPRAPRPGVESSRPHRSEQLHSALPHPPPMGACHRMGHHHPRKPRRVPTTPHSRPPPQTTTQPTPAVSYHNPHPVRPA